MEGNRLAVQHHVLRIGLATAAVSALAATAALSQAAVSSYRDLFANKVQISIGAELKVLSARYRFDQNVDADELIQAPDVAVVKVVPPRIAALRAYPEQQFIFSAVAKPAPAAEKIERKVFDVLSERFKTLPEGDYDATDTTPDVPSIIEEHAELAPEAISLSAEMDTQDEERLDRVSLALVVSGNWQKNEAAKLAMNIPRANHTKKVNIQVPSARRSAVAKSVLSSPPVQQLVPTTEVPALSKGQLVAWNDVPGVDRLGYSDLVEMLLGSEEKQANEAEPMLKRGPPVKIKPAPQPATLHYISEQPSSPPPIQIVEFPKMRRLGPVVNEDLNTDPKKDAPGQLISTAESSQTSKANEELLVGQNKQLSDIQVAVGNQPIDVKAFLKAKEEANNHNLSGGIITYVAPAAVMPVPAQPPAQPAGPPAPVPPVPPTPPTPPAPPSPSADKAGPKLNIFGLDGGGTNQTQSPSLPPLYGGRVMEAFTGGTKTVANADVQILGTQLTTKTDENGSFGFNDITVSGVLPVIITKEGYLKRRLELKKGRSLDVELVAENAVSLSSVAAGESTRPDSSFVFGQLVSTTGESIEAMRIDINGPAVAHPVYLDINGIPNKMQQMTSARGQFMLLNVQPGTYVITAIDAFGRERAPHILHVGAGEGVVRKFSLGEQRFINGKVFNASGSNAVVDEASVRLLGSEKSAVTAKNGAFTLGPIYVDCNESNYLQIDKSGFYRNRVDYACDANGAEHQIYIFTASYVDGISNDTGTQLKPTTGVVLGHVSYNSSVKMQLWGPEEVNPGESSRGKDFYFDGDGVVNTIRDRTSNSGNFVIVDAPEGLSYMQAFSAKNRTLSYWPIFTSPSTVNVYVQ